MTFHLKYKNKLAQIIELLKNYLIVEENLRLCMLFRFVIITKKIEEEWIFVLQKTVCQEDYEQLIQIRNFSSWRRNFISTSIFVDREG